jgi:hypothetical protein
MVGYLGFTYTLIYGIILITSQYITNFILDLHFHLFYVFCLSILCKELRRITGE